MVERILALERRNEAQEERIKAQETRSRAQEARLQQAETTCQQQASVIEAVIQLRADVDQIALRATEAHKAAQFLQERMDSTDGLASTLNDMITMHEAVLIEVQSQTRTLAGRLAVLEASGSLGQTQGEQPGGNYADILAQVRGEAAVEFARICGICDALGRRLGEVERKQEVLVARQTSPVTRHVSPVPPQAVYAGGEPSAVVHRATPSPPEARQINGVTSVAAAAPTVAVLASPDQRAMGRLVAEGARRSPEAPGAPKQQKEEAAREQPAAPATPPPPKPYGFEALWAQSPQQVLNAGRDRAAAPPPSEIDAVGTDMQSSEADRQSAAERLAQALL